MPEDHHAEPDGAATVFPGILVAASRPASFMAALTSTYRQFLCV